MLRAVLCLTLGMFVCADAAVANAAKKAKPVSGKIAKVDADKGTLTVKVKSKSDTSNKDFVITDSAQFVTYLEDGTTTEKLGKEGLKDPVVNVGAKVKVTVDSSGAVIKVELGKLPKKRTN